VVLVGSVRSYKNFAWMVSVLDEWCRHASLTLEVFHVGNVADAQAGRELKEAVDSARHLRVRLLGRESHEKALGVMAACDWFLFPSQRESFGIPLAEAMALRMQIACTDLEVFREVAGSSALYFHLNRDSAFEVLDQMLKAWQEGRSATRAGDEMRLAGGWDVLGVDLTATQND
jgi:glycosyltransferase involved in cell wall biosynthesis